MPLKKIGLERGIENISKKKGVGARRGRSWQERGEEKIEMRIVTLKETMGEIIVPNYVVKKVESLVQLLWYNICFFIKTIL